MNIYLGADHQGFYLKEKVYAYLVKRGYVVTDAGNAVLDPDDDYPEFAQMAVMKIMGDNSHDPRAILLCGGHGMAIAANRFHSIRACTPWDGAEAKQARHELDSNVLCLSVRAFEPSDDRLWQAILETWLTVPFSRAARHQRRINQLDQGV